MRIGWHEDAARPVRPNLATRAAVRLVTAFQTALAAERDRWVLWTPVCFGLGIAFYFALPAEPPDWAGGLAAALAALAAVALRRRPGALLLAAAVLLAAAGFWRAQLETMMVSAPVLQERLGPATVSGRVIRVETLERGQRLWVDRLTVERLAAEATPERVRVRQWRVSPEIAPGDRIAFRGILMPPPGPAAPGAYDFARRAFFDRIGAVGVVFGEAAVTEPRAGEGDWRVALARIRSAATQRIQSGIGGTSGAIAAALMTGERGAIPEDVLTAMRDSGLAHLLSISGLHMSFVAGILFFAIRLGLAAIEPAALRFPIKKWAALGALAGAFGYLLVSGATIPTQRSFFMTAVVLLAVLLDRSAISMRLIAAAALFVLAWSPDGLLGASFQLSFAAVVALIAFYESGRAAMRRWAANASLVRRLLLYLGGVLMTSVVAGLATAPIAAFHFNRVAMYGIAANMIAVPLTGAWIMPWAIVAFLLMPFGLHEAALQPMGWGIDVVIAVARTVSSWPGAVHLVPTAPAIVLPVVALGGLWLCLWRTRWRLAGAGALALGIALFAAADPPDLLVDRDSRLMAARLADGTMAVSSNRKGFQRDMWLRRGGEADGVDWPDSGAAPGGGLACDPLGCIYARDGRTVALALHRAALEEDCARVDVVVSFEPVWRRHCREPQLLIGSYDLWRDGPVALWLTRDGVRLATVRASVGFRPWTRAWQRARSRRRASEPQ